MNKLVCQTASICSRRAGVASLTFPASDGQAKRSYHRSLDLSYQVYLFDCGINQQMNSSRSKQDCYVTELLCFSKVFTTFHFADENEYLKICNKKTLN